ncbi:ATP-dependent DNA helicase, partial [Aphis craccivora]
MMNWVTRARILSQKINLEFNVLRMLMYNHHSDNSIHVDESIIMMSLGDVFRLSRRITNNHIQFYIFMQLLYWLRRLEEIEPIKQGSPTSGPRSGYGPRALFYGPRARFHLTLLKFIRAKPARETRRRRIGAYEFDQ